jgi:hypothetical protein
MMNLGVTVSIFDHKKKRKCICCDGSSKIFNFINKSPHEFLLRQLSIFLIKFFCNQKIFCAIGRVSPNQQSIIHNGMEVGIVNHSQGLV